MHVRQFLMQNAFVNALHLRALGGLICKICNIILVLKLFLKGHVEARLAIGLLLRNHAFSVFFATSIFATPLAF